MKGQITRETKLGDWIYTTVQQDDIKTIVEIGTGSGLGSTKCVTDAMQDDMSKEFWTVESNSENWNLASKNIPNRPNIHLLYGHVTAEVIDYQKMAGSLFRGYNHSQCASWLARDLEEYKTGRNVINLLPTNIDLLILDGGVFTSYAEFLALKDLSEYIVLDDTMDIKNHDARQYILTNFAQYDILFDEKADRNGYMVVRRLW